MTDLVEQRRLEAIRDAKITLELLSPEPSVPPVEVGGLVKRLRAAEASERIYGSDRTADLIAEADDAIEALAGALASERAARRVREGGKADG